MEIKEVYDKNIWEGFLTEREEKTFLQSWNWGEFQKKMGNKIWRIGIYDDDELIAVCLIVLVKAKRGTYLLIQHGPILSQKLKIKPSSRAQVEGTQNCNSKVFEILNLLTIKLKEIARNENADFVRIAPIFEDNEDNLKIFKELGFKQAPMHANAYEATWRLDIQLTDEELLKNVRKTTRYLIKKARENQDITIEKSDNQNDIKIYQNLNKEVSKRQKFAPFSENYIKTEFEIFSKDKEALLFFGRYKGNIVAGAVVIFWSGIGFYHQAASIQKYAKLSIPYLLQWEAIKEAKKRGCLFYDFWGFTDPIKFPKHPWAGPTLFKMGFGGRSFKYVKTQDLPISKNYWFINLFERLRKIKRHF